MAKKPTLETVYNDYELLDLDQKVKLFQLIKQNLEDKSDSAATELALVDPVLNKSKSIN